MKMKESLATNLIYEELFDLKYSNFRKKYVVVDKNQEDVELTKRQAQCVYLASQGISDRQMAVILGVSSSAVHGHMLRAKKVLKFKSRAEIINLPTVKDHHNKKADKTYKALEMTYPY